MIGDMIYEMCCEMIFGVDDFYWGMNFAHERCGEIFVRVDFKSGIYFALLWFCFRLGTRLVFRGG